jgi:hypothetical protein
MFPPHVAERWLPADLQLIKEQLNACAPYLAHGNVPRWKPNFR